MLFPSFSALMKYVLQKVSLYFITRRYDKFGVNDKIIMTNQLLPQSRQVRPAKRPPVRPAKRPPVRLAKLF